VGDLQPGSGDTNGTNDVYLHDRIADVTLLVSHQPGNPGASLGADSRAEDLSDDARRVTFTADEVPFTYDRQSRRSSPLLTAFYDPEEPLRGEFGGASVDGSRILLLHEGSQAVPFDADPMPDTYLVTLGDLFADGFEGGDTAAWSQTVP
jgi:hypothetical protein